MKFEITKDWKELPYKIITIKAPSIPGIRITASDVQPTGEVGIIYSGQEVQKFSEQKLWIKIPESQKIEKVVVEIENFI